MDDETPRWADVADIVAAKINDPDRPGNKTEPMCVVVEGMPQAEVDRVNRGPFRWTPFRLANDNADVRVHEVHVTFDPTSTLDWLAAQPPVQSGGA